MPAIIVWKFVDNDTEAITAPGAISSDVTGHGGTSGRASCWVRRQAYISTGTFQIRIFHRSGKGVRSRSVAQRAFVRNSFPANGDIECGSAILDPMSLYACGKEESSALTARQRPHVRIFHGAHLFLVVEQRAIRARWRYSKALNDAN